MLAAYNQTDCQILIGHYTNNKGYLFTIKIGKLELGKLMESNP